MFTVKPFPEPMLTYYQLDMKGDSYMKFELNTKIVLKCN